MSASCECSKSFKTLANGSRGLSSPRSGFWGNAPSKSSLVVAADVSRLTILQMSFEIGADSRPLLLFLKGW